jgi:hypothetical protein
VPRGGKQLLAPETKAMLKGQLPAASFTPQPADLWGIARLQAPGALAAFGTEGPPPLLAKLLESPREHNAALMAFAGMHEFLRRSLLDKAVLSLRCIEELYPGGATPVAAAAHSEPANGTNEGDSGAAAAAADCQAPLVLDGAALSNLEV